MEDFRDGIDESEINGPFVADNENIKDMRTKTQKAKSAAKETAKRAISETLKNLIKTIFVRIWPYILIGLVVIILFICCWDIVSNAAMTNSVSSISSSINSSNTSQKLAENYGTTGSLLLATDDDIANIYEDYINMIRMSDTSYLVKYLEKKVSILNENNSGIYLNTENSNDPVDLGEDKTLYEHIMNTERYNFNRVKWLKYTRGELQSDSPELLVDTTTRLQYPKDDNYDLDRFVNMLRPYLQTWMIPMSMLSGVAYNTTTDDFSNFAYQIISEGYSRIQMAQHSLDTKTRTNNYLIYDKKITTVKVNRTCTTYETTKEMTCTDNEYNKGIGGCVRPATWYMGFDDKGNPKKVLCSDSELASELNGCTKGNSKVAVGTQFEVCVDTETSSETTTPDIRENISSTDVTSTEYTYVLNSAETFDYIVKDSYNFEKYYEDNATYSEDLSKTDSHSSESKEYYNKEESKQVVPINTKIKLTNANDDNCKVVGEPTTATYDSNIITEKTGLEYTDTLIWKDKLKYDATGSFTQKGYTVEQLRNYIGLDKTLDVNEVSHYTSLETSQRLNLIDILNAKKDIYTTYTDAYSPNMGYSRMYLTTSYDILKKNLQDLYANYDRTIIYGQSIVPIIDNKKGLVNTYDYTWLSEGQFGWPVPGNYTVGYLFGYTAAYGSEHGGIDLWPDSTKAAYETDVVAAKAGTVVVANDYGAASGNKVSPEAGGGWGNYIKIDHGDGSSTLYAHLYAGSFTVKEGETVEAGQVIAYMGSSGNSTGTHLHFELYNGQEKVDPLIVYNVESIGGNPEYETMSLDDAVRRSISQAGVYKYVSSK